MSVVPEEKDDRERWLAELDTRLRIIESRFPKNQLVDIDEGHVHRTLSASGGSINVFEDNTLEGAVLTLDFIEPDGNVVTVTGTEAEILLSLYAMLTGRSGGQTLRGGSGSGEHLTLRGNAVGGASHVIIQSSHLKFPSSSFGIIDNNDTLRVQVNTSSPHIAITGDLTDTGILTAAEQFRLYGEANVTWTAQTDNYNLSSQICALRVTLTGDQTLTGMQGGTQGRILVIHNIDDTDTLTIQDDNGADSTAIYRFELNADITLDPGMSAMFRYDISSFRWRCVAIYGASAAAASVSPLVLANDITHTITGIGSTQNDINPAGLSTANVIALTSGGGTQLSGITAQSDGFALILYNTGATSITLLHDLTSSDANRFFCPADTNYVLAAHASVWIVYDADADGAVGKWLVHGRTVTATAANYTAYRSYDLVPDAAVGVDAAAGVQKGRLPTHDQSGVTETLTRVAVQCSAAGTAGTILIETSDTNDEDSATWSTVYTITLVSGAKGVEFTASLGTLTSRRMIRLNISSLTGSWKDMHVHVSVTYPAQSAAITTGFS